MSHSLWLVILLIVCSCVFGRDLHNPLQPFFARVISGAGEPSGVTFCDGYLWIISDEDHFIYQSNTEGEIIRKWDIAGIHDIEAITCDPINKWIYVAEEKIMRITSFLLPDINDPHTFKLQNGKKSLRVRNQFIVDLSDYRDSSSHNGIEGLTWVPTTETFIVANEKSPSLLATVSQSGVVEGVVRTSFSGDLSGLAYDEELDKLWVLSDQSERLFLTDVTGNQIYDYWDLDMHNPEGVVINNEVDPPQLYIVTDPSSPHGDQYVPAIFEFTKPQQGSGLKYYNKNDPPPPKIECDGCDKVEHLADKMKESSGGVPVYLIVIGSVFSFVGLLVFVFLVGVMVILSVLVFKRKQTEAVFDSFLDNDDLETSSDSDSVDQVQKSFTNNWLQELFFSAWSYIAVPTEEPLQL